MSNISTRSTTSARELVDRAVARVSVAKAAPADSFVLHAPLELMARVHLLRYLRADDREAALGMIEWLSDEYERAGDPVEPMPTPMEVLMADGRPAALIDALAAGDADRVDALASAALPTMSAAEVVGAFGEAIVPSLAAAGHAPIGLALLLRDRAATGLSPTLLRGPLRSLASHPDWQVSWYRNHSGRGDATGLYDALRSAPYLGRPGSDFIHPLMTQAQQPGVADRLLGPLLADRYHVPAALHTLTRVAAWSMLHDDPAHAPYGWSHAMTMPQGVLALAGAGVRARTALAVASTYALGFRLAFGRAPLPERIAPSDGGRSHIDVHELAAAASMHHDAHLVKYTLACLHAAADDPEFADLYAAAAQFLLDWWRANG
ncbi:MAG: hypothetical protein Q8M22_06170 [Actinomycetota bacterium]|nr:hypothetical protein [Actinomycetota bacterium]